MVARRSPSASSSTSRASARRPPDGYEGFDVDVATYVAKKLGYSEDQIEWKESKSADRETMLQRGDVDFIAATYSITPERQEKVDFAGPYLLAHQDVLIRADDDKIKSPEDLNDAKLCSVTGSTSAQNVKEKLAPKAQLQPYPTYSACLPGLQNGAIDALTTDDSISPVTPPRTSSRASSSSAASS